MEAPVGTIGICILSWKNPQLLERTLETYFKQHLFNLVPDHLVLFQEASPADHALAEKLKLRYITTSENLGIYGGVKRLAETIQTDYVLLLEDDCILIENESEVKRQFALAATRLAKREVDVYRLRHRWKPGEKFDTVDKYKRYYNVPGEPFSFVKYLRRLFRPEKYRRLMGSAVYVHDAIKGKPYSTFITPQAEGDYIIRSPVMNWTNQSVLCKRSWLLETILPYVEQHPSRRTVNGLQDIEKSLNSRWWREQDFKIGVGLGLFSHQRLGETVKEGICHNNP